MIEQLLNLLRPKQRTTYEGRHRAAPPKQRQPESSDSTVQVN